MNSFYFFLLLLIPSLHLSAQNQVEIEIAQQHLQIADSLRLEKKYTLSLESYAKAITIFKTTNQWEEYLEAATNESICLRKTGQYEEAINQLHQLLKIVKKEAFEGSLLQANIYHQLGVVNYYIDKYEQAVEDYNKALIIRRKNLGINHKDVFQSYFNIGTTYDFWGDFDKSLIHIETALKIAENLKLNDKILSCYQKLGDISYGLGAYEQAHQFYSQLVPSYLAFYGKESIEIGELYTLLGNSSNFSKKWEEALGYYKLSKNIFSQKKSPQFILGLANCYNNIGNVFFEKEKFEDALKNYKLALEINLKNAANNNQTLSINYTNLGLTYSELNEFDKAVLFLNKALIISKKNFPKFDARNQEVYYNLGTTYLGIKDYTNTLLYYQKALFTVLPNFREEDFLKNPDLTNGQIRGDNRTIILILKSKAKALRLFSQSKNNDLSLLRFSLSTSKLAFQVINLMRQDHIAEGSKLFWTEETLPVFENAIQTAKELYDLTKEKQYLKEAFAITEKSKSVVLLGSMRDSEAKQFAGIPENLLTKEKELKKALVEQKEALFQEKQKNITADSSNIKELETAIFESTLAYNDLIDQLEKDHPDYHRMKYDMGTASLEEVQSWLNEDQAMLSYFVGDSASYVFKVLKNDLELVILEEDYPLEERVTDLRQSLYSYHLDPNRSDELYLQMAATYVQTAHDLHRRLIHPLGNLPEHLIILPAGLLGYIPFEVLLSEEPTKVTDFVNHPYLLRKHTISYTYSATLLREMLEQQHQPKYRKLLAFAPAFEASQEQYADMTAMRSDLTALMHNIPEAESIHNVLGGTLFSNEDATKEKFLAEASKYSILHCATHGKADDVNSNYSYLAFSNADSIDHLLYVQDLYNMNLNADMVTLSACETGIGKLYRGEGVASIARGFSYAGAKSIITTLWSVNDQKMAEIMALFYQNLATGLEKDVALRNAKLTYLEDQKQNFAHPFYWAATIPIGDMGAIGVENRNWWIWGFSFGFGYVILMFFMKRRNKRTRQV